MDNKGKIYTVEQCNISSFNIPRFSINSRYIEYSINIFDGSGFIPVDDLINDYGMNFKNVFLLRNLR